MNYRKKIKCVLNFKVEILCCENGEQFMNNIIVILINQFTWQSFMIALSEFFHFFCLYLVRIFTCMTSLSHSMQITKVMALCQKMMSISYLNWFEFVLHYGTIADWWIPRHHNYFWWVTKQNWSLYFNCNIIICYRLSFNMKADLEYFFPCWYYSTKCCVLHLILLNMKQCCPITLF